MTDYLNQDESFRYEGQKTLLAPTALQEDDLLDDKGIFNFFQNTHVLDSRLFVLTEISL